MGKGRAGGPAEAPDGLGRSFRRSPGAVRPAAGVGAGTGYAGRVFGLSNALLTAISLAVLVLHVWALVDCVVRPANAFEAAGKLTKPAWLAITGIALALGLLFSPLGLFGLVAIVASIVYLVDVRPAVKEIQGGGNRW